ncbi:MAG: hypothetical protein AAB373_02455 [Patescibacteria group bacterium]
MGKLDISALGGYVDEERELTAALYTDKSVLERVCKKTENCPQDNFYEFALCENPKKESSVKAFNRMFDKLGLSAEQRKVMRLRIRSDSVELTFKSKSKTEFPETHDKTGASDKDELVFPLNDANVQTLTDGKCKNLGEFLQAADQEVFAVTERTRRDCLDLLKPALGELAQGIKAIHIDPFKPVDEASGPTRFFKIDIEAESAEMLDMLVTKRVAIFGKIQKVLKVRGLHIVQDGIPKASKEEYGKTQFAAAGKSAEDQWKQKPSEVWKRKKKK